MSIDIDWSRTEAYASGPTNSKAIPGTDAGSAKARS